MLRAQPQDKNFLDAVKKLKEGNTIKTTDGVFLVEYVFNVPSHFPFHQRIFPAGVILKKETSRLRIFIEAEKLGMKLGKLPEGMDFEDRQIAEDGTVLPADPETQFQPKK